MRRVGIFALLLLLVAILAAGYTGWHRMKASLPLLDGTIEVAGVAGEATIARDAIGVVTITADSPDDLAFALGYAHGQDRFFQMDLTRRRAAGELSALFGEIAVEADKTLRLHRFRARAEGLLASAPAASQSYLEAYAAGVNAALSATEQPPFEYLVLGAEPEPWQATDSLLVIYSMFIELNDERGERDALRGLLDEHLPPELVAFLTPAGTPWDCLLYTSDAADDDRIV